MTKSLTDRVLDMWRDGKTASQIAEALGMCARAVERRVLRSRKMGDARAAPHARPKAKPAQRPATYARAEKSQAIDEQIVELARLGRSMSAIAFCLGMTRNAVAGRVNRMKRRGDRRVVGTLTRADRLPSREDDERDLAVLQMAAPTDGSAPVPWPVISRRDGRSARTLQALVEAVMRESA